MSDDLPEIVAPALRREALLPDERSRGLGTVAVVCTMAGVASGLALATTLMAMQVADSMSTRGCPYPRRSPRRWTSARSTASSASGTCSTTVSPRSTACFPEHPPKRFALQPGDHVISINGDRVDSANELQERIYGSHPGRTPTLVIERNGDDADGASDADRVACDLVLSRVDWAAATDRSSRYALRAVAEPDARRHRLVVALERDDDLVAEVRADGAVGPTLPSGLAFSMMPSPLSRL